MLVEVEEIVALQELVSKLGERQSVASRSVQSLLHALLRHHVVDGDVLAYLTCEVKESEVLHPVVVVHHFSVGSGPLYGPRGGFVTLDIRVPLGGRKGGLGPKVQELGHLSLDALLIVAQCLVVEQIALLTLS